MFDTSKQSGYKINHVDLIATFFRTNSNHFMTGMFIIGQLFGADEQYWRFFWAINQPGAETVADIAVADLLIIRWHDN